MEKMKEMLLEEEKTNKESNGIYIKKVTNDNAGNNVCILM
jgi:hypothetical protein